MKKQSGKIQLIIIIFIILILLIGVLFLYKKYQGQDLNNIESTENGPIIYYYDKEQDKKIEIQNEQVFLKEIEIYYSKGTAKISKNDSKYIDYKEETKLTDGRYILIVQAEDNTVTKKEFIIDTLAPKVLGIQIGVYKSDQTFELEDPEDVKIATLSKKDGETVDLKNILMKRGDKYTVSENGTYIIYLEDYHGNANSYKFIINK